MIAGPGTVTLILSVFLLSPSILFSQNYQWAKSIGGIALDWGYDIAVDAIGNTHIIGNFGDTVDFDPGPGTVNLVSAGNGDIYFAKYDHVGNYLWAKRIGSTGNDGGYSIAVDAIGNVYITGSYEGTADFDPGSGIAQLTSAGGADIFFAKYDNAGNYIWAKSIGSTSTFEIGRHISFDTAGNVYVSGGFVTTVDFDPGPGNATLVSAGNFDIFFAKYNGSGNFLWAKRIGGKGREDDRELVVDDESNVHLVGVFNDTVDFDVGPGTTKLASNHYEDIFFAKYDVGGNFLWAKSIGSNAANDAGEGMAVDGGGNVYITGQYQSTIDFDPGGGTANLTSAGKSDIFFAKYNSNGDYIWAKSIGDTNWDHGHSIAHDVGGSIYITGTFNGTIDYDPGPGSANLTSAGNLDFYFAKYDSNGNYLWSKKIGGTSNDFIYSIALDLFGGAYIIGLFEGTVDFDPGTASVNLTSSGSLDTYLAKYNANPTSIPDVPSSDDVIRIYPNPNNGNFIIDFAEVGQSLKDRKIEIYSLLGEKLHSEKIQNENIKTISLNLPNGIYLIKIETEKEEVVRKIMIQNL